MTGQRPSYLLLFDMLLFDMSLLLIELPDMVLPDMVLPAVDPPDMLFELMLLLDIEFDDMPLSEAVLPLLLLPQAARPVDSRAAAVTRITFFIFDAFLREFELNVRAIQLARQFWIRL